MPRPTRPWTSSRTLAQTLDYSYQRQLDLLQKVRRGVADVATSRKRVEIQANQLNLEVDKLTQQAQKALEVGREDLAREALTRRSGVQQQLADLQAQHAQLQAEEEKLTRASQRLKAKVDAFRTRKETIKATYSAAEAQTRINEAFTGISEEMGDVGLAIQRAEDKTAQMQARAGAIDELLASGALEDPTGMAKDDITLELEQLASSSDVENELARMKASLGAGPSAATPGDRGPAGWPGVRADRSPQQAPQQQALPSSRPRQPNPQGYQAPAPYDPQQTQSQTRDGGAAVIVRILGEGQWRVEDSAVADLNELDAEVERAVAADDQAELSAALSTLLGEVRGNGVAGPGRRRSRTPI